MPALSLLMNTTAALASLPTLPYTLCTTSTSCVTIPTKLILDGPVTDFSTYEYQPIPNGMLIGKPAPDNRMYLLSPLGEKYEQVYLKNRMLEVEVDVSEVGCGYNAAFYGVAMNPTAAPGTAYCDAQGTCNEMDFIEANIAVTQIASHSCISSSGTGCDKWGCTVNTRRLDPSTFNIDFTQPFKVTTYFRTNDGTDQGTLSSVEQTYTQNQKTFFAPRMDSGFCGNQGNIYWESTGKLEAMSKAMDEGMTMVFSLWGDGGKTIDMSWLDGGMGTEGCKKVVGGRNRVKFSNIKVAPIHG
ncbi:hypothetical protein HDV05_006251 [Chytridiales sp. JEL 0842]|nr:hypothetical protein HDV05_006251 [Chytridiales sp. JEL 0842]